MVLAGFIGLVAWLIWPDEEPDPVRVRGIPEGGQSRVNAEIVGLDDGRPGKPAERPAPVAPVRLSPAGSAGGGAVSGSTGHITGGVVGAVPPPPCAPSLLQTILGLGASLLGGRPGC